MATMYENLRSNCVGGGRVDISMTFHMRAVHCKLTQQLFSKLRNYGLSKKMSTLPYLQS
jgi:hypothetical protein